MKNPSVVRRAAASYRDLEVWQLAMDLVVEVYSISREFPSDERFGLTSQMRRAAVSVPANIAEGNARFSRAEYRRFVAIARGSLCELETHIELVRRLNFVGDAQVASIEAHAASVGKMLTNLWKRLGQ